MSNVTKKFQDQVAVDAYAARDFMPQLGWFLVNAMLLLAIIPEYQIASITTESSMRSWDGVLTDIEAARIPYIAGVICLVTVVTFHWCLRRMSRFDGGRYVIWVLLGICVVTLSQPIVILLSELRFGNSIGAANNGQLSFQNQLLTWGYMARAFFILAAAFVAGFGLLGMEKAWRGMWKARQNGRDAQTGAEVVTMIDDGVKQVVAARSDGLAYNRDLVSQLALGVTDGYIDMSRAVTRYIKGPDGLFMNPEHWLEDVANQFDQPATPSNPKVATLVQARLKRHAIDLTLLPTLPDDLSAKAREDLSRYAGWLWQQADYDAVYNSTILETGA